MLAESTPAFAVAETRAVPLSGTGRPRTVVAPSSLKRRRQRGGWPVLFYAALVVYIPIVLAILIACIILRDAAHASIRIARAISGRTGTSLAPHVSEPDPLA